MITGRLLLFETNVWVAIDTHKEVNVTAVYKPYGKTMIIGSNNQYTSHEVSQLGWGRKYKVNDYRAWWEGVIKTPLKLCSIYDPHITDWDL